MTVPCASSSTPCEQLSPKVPVTSVHRCGPVPVTMGVKHEELKKYSYKIMLLLRMQTWHVPTKHMHTFESFEMVVLAFSVACSLKALATSTFDFVREIDLSMHSGCCCGIE